MNTLTEQDLRTHVPIVAVLMIVTHAFYLVGAGIVFAVLLLVGGLVGNLGMVSGDVDAARVLPTVGGGLMLLGIFLAGLFALLSLPGIIAGVGLLQKKAWARILAIVVAILGLLHFPIGTLIGAYTIFVLLQDSAPSYFETPGANARTQLQPA